MEWDRHSNDILSPAQFRAMINSTTWHSMDRGEVTLKEACEVNSLETLTNGKTG